MTAKINIESGRYIKILTGKVKMITLKLQLGKEIRRIGQAPEKLEKVKEKAKELFDISSPCFRYRDNENDEITIMNQREYEEALSAHSGPIKLEVLESEILLFERSSAIRNSTKSHIKGIVILNLH